MEAANKLKPIKTTTTTTSKPKPTDMQKVKKDLYGHMKSGGKVTKTYANGGGVRKPKYKG